MRYGFYRPALFMSGLELGLWLNATTLMAWWLRRCGLFKRLWGLSAGSVVFLLVITSIMFRATGATVLIATGFFALWFCTKIKTKWVVWGLVVIAPTYYCVRITNLWTGRDAVELIRTHFSEERAESLEARLWEDDLLIARALKRPAFGWGGYNRSRIMDDDSGNLNPKMLPAVRRALDHRLRDDGLHRPGDDDDRVDSAGGAVPGALSRGAVGPPRFGCGHRVRHDPGPFLAGQPVQRDDQPDLSHRRRRAGQHRPGPHRAVGIGSRRRGAHASRAPAGGRPVSQAPWTTSGRQGETIWSRAIDEVATRSLRPREDLAARYQALGRASKDRGQPTEAKAAWQHALDLLSELTAAHPERPALRQRWCDCANDLAWLLVSVPDPAVQDPARAVALAMKAAEAHPECSTYWNTLGAAHYRAGDFEAAVTALDRATALGNGGTAFDHVFLAMARAARQPGRRSALVRSGDTRDGTRSARSSGITSTLR